MQTVNGKLVATDRQELEIAIERITILERHYQQQAAEVKQIINSNRELPARIGLLEQKIAKLGKQISTQKSSSKLLIILAIGSLCMGSMWAGHKLTNRVEVTPVKVKKLPIVKKNYKHDRLKSSTLALPIYT